MEKTVKILYKTDHHHSHSTKEILGIYTNKQSFLKDCKEIIENDIRNNLDESEENTEEDIKTQVNYTLGFLMEKNQTQDLNDFELYVEEEDLNTYNSDRVTPYI